MLAIVGAARAQVMVSNLTATAGGTLAFAPTQSAAGAFRTGSTASVLENVTLALGNATGSTSVFTVALYSSNLNAPGTLIKVLSGPASPQGAGNHSFTSLASTPLDPHTTYFWVGMLASSGSTDSRRVLLTFSLGETSADGWTILDYNYTQTNSGSWTATTTRSPVFSVCATAVPEPGTYAAFAGAAAFGFVVYRRRGTT